MVSPQGNAARTSQERSPWRNVQESVGMLLLLSRCGVRVSGASASEYHRGARDSPAIDNARDKSAMVSVLRSRSRNGLDTPRMPLLALSMPAHRYPGAPH
jgi:hypothetical protein